MGPYAARDRIRPFMVSRAGGAVMRLLALDKGG